MGARSGPPPASPPGEWPHRPVYVCAHPTTRTPAYAPLTSLPLGVPVEVESDLFRGRVLLRLKPVPADADPGHDAYFQGAKRHYQFVVQGRFAEAFALSDLAIGDKYDKPFVGIPKGYIMKLYEKFMQTISPGLLMDMTSATPSLFNALGSCQTMRVDRPGDEPDLGTGAAEVEVEEDTALLFGGPKFASAAKRRGYLSKPKNAAKHRVDPNHVYTLEMYDHTMCFGSYRQHALGTTIDMAASMNGQPLCLALFARGERPVVKIAIWHERLLEKIAKDAAAPT